MKILLSLYLCVNFLTIHSQVSNFYGIDMNKDWYTLTDQSGMYYDVYSVEYPDNPYVSVSPKKSLSLDKFEKIGLGNIQLHFERNVNSDFHFFKPTLCTANKVYIDDGDFNLIGQKDFTNVKSDLIQKYGQPSQNVNGTVAKTSYWNSTNYEIALTLDLKTLELILMYRSKN